jgi:PBP1b-binding outer membrane lipoprotein LpoB
MRLAVFALASALVLAGCAGKTDDSAEAAKTAQAQATTPQQKTVFDPQLQALQKAKDVQKVIDAGDARNRKAVDDAEKDKNGDDGG